MFSNRRRRRSRREPAGGPLRQPAHCPAITRDGIGIKLLLNAGLLIDMPQLAATGAEGVGLFRTEIPFMVRDTFPAVDDQTEFYRSVFDQADGRPVVFRTLDIGGDKLLPYLPHAAEDNPAMGWRASVSDSTGRRCCANNCVPWCAPPRAASCSSSSR